MNRLFLALLALLTGLAAAPAQAVVQASGATEINAVATEQVAVGAFRPEVSVAAALPPTRAPATTRPPAVVPAIEPAAVFVGIDRARE